MGEQEINPIPVMTLPPETVTTRKYEDEGLSVRLIHLQGVFYEERALL